MALKQQNIMPCKILVVCIVVLFARMNNAFNILAIETIGGYSHWKVFSGVLRILISQGNNVTIYTPFPDDGSGNCTEVDLSSDYAKGVNVPLDMLQDNFTNPYKSYLVLREIGKYMCDKMYVNTKIMKALERPEDFDLVIMEPLWSDCVSYVSAKMDLPLIYITAFSAISFKESSIAGGYSNPFKYANILLPYSSPTTIFQKIENVMLFLEDFVISVFDYLLRFIHPKPYEISDPIPPIVVFANSHTIVEKPRPRASKVLNIGGIHLNKPKPLPAVSIADQIII